MTFKITLITVLIASAGAVAAADAGLNAGHVAALDKNGDGAISNAEYSAFSNYAFEQMDTNKDGTLSANEISPHLSADSFDQLDKSGNGAVTPDEFSNQMQADFETADTDSDGVLD